MRIRLADIDDAAAISALVKPLAQRSIAADFPPEGVRNLLDSLEPGVIAHNFATGMRYHVAEEDATLVGVIGMSDNYHLFHLFVAEPYQGRGIATALWRVARQACVDAGNTVRYTVNASRLAVPFYRKLGFVQAGVVETRNGVTSVPMIADEG